MLLTALVSGALSYGAATVQYSDIINQLRLENQRMERLYFNLEDKFNKVLEENLELRRIVNKVLEENQELRRENQELKEIIAEFVRRQEELQPQLPQIINVRNKRSNYTA